MSWLAYAGASFAALLPLVNPLQAIPIFTGLTVSATDAERRQMARRTGIYVLLILLVSQALGHLVLSLFGLSLGMLQIAGGLIVANAGWGMSTGAPRVSRHEAKQFHLPDLHKLLRAQRRRSQRSAHAAPARTAATERTGHAAATRGESQTETADQPQRKPAPDISFTPMAMPLLAGPGAMGIIIGLEVQSPGIVDSLGLALGTAGIALATAVCLLAAVPLGRYITPGAAIAMQRIFGFIVLAIAVALIASGISALFGIPLHGSPG